MPPSPRSVQRPNLNRTNLSLLHDLIDIQLEGIDRLRPIHGLSVSRSPAALSRQLCIIKRFRHVPRGRTLSSCPRCVAKLFPIPSKPSGLSVSGQHSVCRGWRLPVTHTVASQPASSSSPVSRTGHFTDGPGKGAG